MLLEHFKLRKNMSDTSNELDKTKDELDKTEDKLDKIKNKLHDSYDFNGFDKDRIHKDTGKHYDSNGFHS